SKKTNNKDDELSNYLSSPVSVLHSSPLEEWEDIKTMYPLLYKQARTVLVVVASSVPCERLFSKAVATITQTRNRLTGKHLEKLFLFRGYIRRSIFL
ncbi:Zinc finger BED domain-containing protein 1, partial [Dufourea novaeangliae]